MTFGEPDPARVRDLICDNARKLGFARVGIIPVQEPQRYQAYRDWLAVGYAGTMTFLAEPAHVEGRRHPGALAAGARTLVVVASVYPGHDDDIAPDDSVTRGFVARYARGRDYHQVMKRKLFALAEELSIQIGRPVAARPCVDTAPVLERDLAERAGIGFVAKNTMLIAPGLGSYILLGELLLDVDAAATGGEIPRSRCGSCTACMQACPTGAFADPFVLDARRCISYLTIEHRGAIPHEHRRAIGTRIFGCDICQEVCPFNQAAPRRAPTDPELAGDLEHSAPDLIALLELGANQRRRYLDGSAMRRVNREQLHRNICVALGNAGDLRAVEPLTRALADRSPIVRAHAAWALGQLGARAPLEQALELEADPSVRDEIAQALATAS